MKKRKNVVVIGGKNGSSRVLFGLRRYPMNITAIVNTFDSGGSTGILRREFGTLPFGDIRGALTALSSDKEVRTLRELFNFRFKETDSLQGHSFGNLFLQALTLSLGSEIKAIKKAAELLKIKGTVLPISTDNAHIHAILEDGRHIKGEANIDVPKHNGDLSINKIMLFPRARLYRESRQAILAADYIIFAPGDLYSSLLPNTLVKGFTEAFSKSKAKVIYIPNLMTKWGETNNFSAVDFVTTLLRYLKLEKLDFVICNSKRVRQSLVKKYKKEKATPVVIDTKQLRRYSNNVISGDIIAEQTFIRHDSIKLARYLNKIINS
ncbi:hypothetical protein A3I95_02585 [Candidatus Nomurabacteria bacterium RIFCSPLOWO2_02_FULL_44_12]|uniref:Putative gluconeogenesis factor n=1 Tax=Candidatus Nomurabacteria bacterium RIFCSPLOWO2_12_FULL_44_11 TaxID=1801796 RepID=A0A1F6Y7R5_9BACT|nr:MAG: hypothetical protein A3E95_00775 [Candidatus Nomurabacteria bacterium RIFCSPHIGHO2_12_FULL_44_22b]OGJ02417.1 MAG: hypothetical protein A3G53_03325 [Candidatus Nomurabacteria bacterium RIFCSPLOWO2_12_FULL_44_11]OGJ07048.1 MAG: hypothetical protein A3I95_02585 [Candidatus Nomurabacteria bacterium RIFCSPLOWO2_02_FULL_44_12]